MYVTIYISKKRCQWTVPTKTKLARLAVENKAAEVRTFDGEDDGISRYFTVVVRNLIDVTFEHRSILTETGVEKKSSE